MLQIFQRLFDNRQSTSVANRMRRKRFALLLDLMGRLPRPISILDIGGTEMFWKNMQFMTNGEVRIVLLNLFANDSTDPDFASRIGDARNLTEFQDGTFDVVFSNSVIEHVGDYADQQSMAREVQRVGRRFFVQTPNRYFPLEPHFLFPFFQFLPLAVRIFLLQHMRLGWSERTPDYREARAKVVEIRLLNERELRALFPGARIYKETVLGLTKSFVVYGGWDA